MSAKRLMFIGVVLLVAFGLCRAAMFRFQEKEDAIRAAHRAELQKLGLTAGAAKAKYPTPEIHMVSSGCIPPGGTGEVVARGKFAPGTKFVFQNDNLSIVKEAATATEYRATLKAAPGIGPQTAALVAIAPSNISANHAVAATVGGSFEWIMDAQNGWRIVARPKSANACGDRNSRDAYEVQFFKQGEANPFAKRNATLYFSMYEKTNYRFSIEQRDPIAGNSQEAMMSLVQRMSDPKLTDAQRDQVMKQLQQIQTQMQKEMQANLAKMSDPNFGKQLEAEKQKFGCERIELEAQTASLTGRLQCSETVGRRIPLTGTMKPLALTMSK